MGFTFYQNFPNRFVDMMLLLLLLLLVLMLWLVCRSHSRTVSVCQATILRGTTVQCTVLPRPLLYSTALYTLNIVQCNSAYYIYVFLILMLKELDKNQLSLL